MKAAESNIIAVPGHYERLWHSCDWKLDGEDKVIFHQRTYTPHNVFLPITNAYWLNGWQHSAEALMEAIEAHGLDSARYTACPEPYGDGFFPSCIEMQDALNYHNAVSCGFSDEELNLITK